MIGYLTNYIRKYFKLKGSRIYKYVITIVEGTQFAVRNDEETYHLYENNDDDGGYIGLVCIESFCEIFSALDKEKTYDITVKKVRI